MGNPPVRRIKVAAEASRHGWTALSHRVSLNDRWLSKALNCNARTSTVSPRPIVATHKRQYATSMLIHREKRFAFLSTPKAASTTIETWLGRTPGMACFAGDSKFKHTDFRSFVKLMHVYGEPADDYEVMCIVRHPLDKARSWFRYRSRQALSGNRDRYLGDRTFDEHVEQILERHRHGTRKFEFLNLDFVRDDQAAVGVDHIFPYHRLHAAFEYLRERLGISLPVPAEALNVSPAIETPLSPALLNAFLQAFAEEIDWYESLA